MRFGLKHLLLFCTAIGTILAISLWLWSLDWNYSHVVSLDCGDGRKIHVYEDFFCDYATIPVYEVTIDGKIITPKYSTFLWFECGNTIREQRFDVTWDDTNGLVAVIYDGQLALVYDFDNRHGWPRTNGHDDVPTDILKRLDIPEKN